VPPLQSELIGARRQLKFIPNLGITRVVCVVISQMVGRIAVYCGCLLGLYCEFDQISVSLVQTRILSKQISGQLRRGVIPTGFPGGVRSSSARPFVAGPVAPHSCAPAPY
jgi:hypothetical protein